MRFIGVDHAWGDINESGLLALRSDGVVEAADWRCGTSATADWIEQQAEPDTLVFIDAPLIVTNAERKPRLCERHVGNRYARYKVSANTTNIFSPRLGGVLLREELERRGFRYDDGLDGPPTGGRMLSECYPYTTTVGAHELGYDRERPAYKRPPKGIALSAFRPLRAANCDELIRRVAQLRDADPPLDLRSHPTTRRLLDEPSPLADRDYKHREDLLDAALSAWTAALWCRFGFERCQVLGAEPALERPAATIIAPARPEQRPSG